MKKNEILAKLSEKSNDSSYNEPQLKLWAKHIHTGAHSDYEMPPNMLLITGKAVASKQAKKSPTQDFHGVINDAVTAFAPALKGPSSPTSTKYNCLENQAFKMLLTGLSPGTQATLR